MSDLQSRFDAELSRLLGGAGAERLGLAVSGGGDSVALMRLAPAGVRVATVDHRLRPESAGEAAKVADWCAALGLPHETLVWSHDGVTGNLPAEARRARYALLADWATRHGLTHVLIGHTEDDIAETFLMRLTREAGLDGLSAMRPVWTENGVAFLRPLLTFSRAELREYLRDLGQDWIDDPTNDDETYDRARIRKALTLLTETGLTPSAIAASARNLATTREALTDLTSHAAKAALRAEDPLTFDADHLLAGPTEITRRIIAAALTWTAGADYPPRRQPLADLILRLKKGDGRHELHTCWVSRRGNLIEFTPQRPMTQRLGGDFLTFLSTH